MSAARFAAQPDERGQAAKFQRRGTRLQGPCLFLAQKVVLAMHRAGYPAFIAKAYRSYEEQSDLYDVTMMRGYSGPVAERPGFSPFQFYEAARIEHESGRHGSEFVITLAACRRIVARKYGVGLVQRPDPLEFELEGWRDRWRPRLRAGDFEGPTLRQLWENFVEVLPNEARAYMRTPKGTLALGRVFSDEELRLLRSSFSA